MCGRHQVAAESKGLRFALNLAADLPAQFSTDPTRPAPDTEQPAEQCRQIHRAGEISLAVSLNDGDVVFTVRDTGVSASHWPAVTRSFEKFKQLEKLPDPRTWRHRAWACTGQEQPERSYGGRITPDRKRRRLDLSPFSRLPERQMPTTPRLAWSSTTSPPPPAGRHLAQGRWGWTVPKPKAAKRRYYSPANTPSGFVLLDISMPGLSGEGKPAPACALRPPGKRPPSLPTAHAFPEDRARLLGGGFDEVLVKPINRQQLETMVAELWTAPPGLHVF